MQGKIHSEGLAYMEDNFPLMDRFLQCKVIGPTDAVPETKSKRHREFLDVPSRKKKASRKKKEHHDALLRSRRSQRSLHSPKQQHSQHERQAEEHITGQLHHQHAVHFNADPNTEEGLTKLSWELVGAVLFLFCGIFLLWLRFALSPSKKSRKTS